MNLDTIHALADEPEYASVEEFVEFCMDDERETFTHVELRALALNTLTSGSTIRTALESFGLALEPRGFVKRTRGHTTNSNDRFYGPGSCKSHGGSGHEQIQGWSGRKG